MKKIVTLLLCVAMLLPTLASCGGGKSGEVSKEKPSDLGISQDVTFEGETFNILCRGDNAFGTYKYEIAPDEGSTDTVNQAVYQRNRDVCDMYGLAGINAIAIDGDWDNKDNFTNKFKNSIDAQLHEFDLIMGCAAYMAEIENSKYFKDFNSMPHVRLDQEYYFQNAIDELTVNGKLKYAIGDICLTYWDRVYVLYFNKQIAEEYNLENIYQLVNDGKWTIDKCLEMASGKWVDNNYDDWPGEEDTFGYISEIPNATDAYHAHFNIPRTEYQNGNVVFDIDEGKMTSILEKMINFKKTNDCRMLYTSSTETVEEVGLNKIFMEGRALFYHNVLAEAQNFRSMDVDFGIVPYPMWDESQGAYYTSSALAHSVAVVPNDIRDESMTGAIFETMSYLSYQNVIPTYYDKALKYKMTRDEDSAAMLDIIRDGLIINFGDFFGWALDPADKMIRELIRHDNTNFSSYYGSHVKAWTRTLTQLMEKFD